MSKKPGFYKFRINSANGYLLVSMDQRDQNVWYIDDEEYNLVVFKNAFFRHYNIFVALSGEEGLKIMEEEDIHLIITDQKMPGMTGIEVLERVVETHPNTVRMILTAYSDIEIIMRAINKCGPRN